MALSDGANTGQAQSFFHDAFPLSSKDITESIITISAIIVVA
jgi:hypothetical protein